MSSLETKNNPIVGYLYHVMMARSERYHKMYITRLERVYRNHNPDKLNYDWINSNVRKYGRTGAEKIHALYEKVCAKYRITPHKLYDGTLAIKVEGDELPVDTSSMSVGDSIATAATFTNHSSSAIPQINNDDSIDSNLSIRITPTHNNNRCRSNRINTFSNSNSKHSNSSIVTSPTHNSNHDLSNPHTVSNDIYHQSDAETKESDSSRDSSEITTKNNGIGMWKLINEFHILLASTTCNKTCIAFLQNRRTGKIKLLCTEKRTKRVSLEHIVPIPEVAKVTQKSIGSIHFVKWYAADTMYSSGSAQPKYKSWICTTKYRGSACRFAEMLKTAGIHNMEDRSEPPDPKPVVIKKWHHQRMLEKFIVSGIGSQKYNALQLVELRESNDDYKLMCSQFMRSSKKRRNDLEGIFIYKIKQRARIEAHENKKKQILKSFEGNVSKLNEIGLYHGTPLDKLPPILHQGFLRQFVSRAAYGKGTYFARNADYSCNFKFSKPDESGFQHLLFCNVICGEWVNGDHTMKVPPIKNGSEYLPYETTVDHEHNPTIFVSYQDDQALPLYLISFKTRRRSFSRW